MMNAVLVAIQQAFALAEEKKHTVVDTLHLLAAFVQEPEGYFPRALQHLGIAVHELEEKLNELPSPG